jgi:hypothetical protein
MIGDTHEARKLQLIESDVLAPSGITRQTAARAAKSIRICGFGSSHIRVRIRIRHDASMGQSIGTNTIGLCNASSKFDSTGLSCVYLHTDLEHAKKLAAFFVKLRDGMSAHRDGCACYT